MKLWISISVYVTLAILIVFGITMGTLVSAWKANVEDIWQDTSSELLQKIKVIIEAHLDTVIFTSRFVPLSSPETLLEYFVRYDQYSGYNFGSIGYLTRANGTQNGKWSWQIADFPSVCPIYGYYFSNASIHPAFHGYCSNFTDIDYDTIAYQGNDWGLKPEEAALVDGTLKEIFLPVHDILGSFTLTFETQRPDSYASFAELSLKTLTQFVQQNVSVWNGQGTVNIVDNDIKKVIISSGPAYNEYTRTFNTKYPGLDWTTYVTVHDIYGDMYYKIMISCVICAIVTAVIIFGVYIATYFWVSKPLQWLKGETEETSFTPISDFN